MPACQAERHLEQFFMVFWYDLAYNFSQKNNSTMDSEAICKQNTQFFTAEKLIDLIVIFFF